MKPNAGSGSGVRSQLEFIKSRQTIKPSQRRYTLEEVRQHCSLEDCWIILGSAVYDVTSYLCWHPGGAGSIHDFAGGDATAAFQNAHSWVAYDSILASCKLGWIQKSDDGIIHAMLSVMVFVIRQEGGEPVLAFSYPDLIRANRIFGVELHDFASFSLPGNLLFNQRFDFSISGKSSGASLLANEWDEGESIRFISYPQESLAGPKTTIDRRVSCFNVLLALDEARATETIIDLSWRALFVFCQGLLSEERRVGFLSIETARLLENQAPQIKKSDLSTSLSDLVEMLMRCPVLDHVNINAHVSVTLNNKNHAHPVELLTRSFVPRDDVQKVFYEDAPSVIRRLTESLDPFKPLKEAMIELGLSSGTINRLSCHLLQYSSIISCGALSDSTRLVLTPSYSSGIQGSIKSDFIEILGSSPSMFEVLSLLTEQIGFQQLADELYSRFGISKPKFILLTRLLIQSNVLLVMNEGLFYSPMALLESKGLLARQQLVATSCLSKNIPQSLKKKFSQQEILAIHAKVGCDAVKTETVLRLIGDVVMERLDLAAVEAKLLDGGVYSTDDFRKVVEHVLSGHEPFLVKYYW